ncbi:hypothetical protein AAG570_003470 [Ranatra chinensis]|uniref:DNA repair protein REV1 n=1 Tax=Ranatra chinensis TaxID=642074 RepID=A0ABD0Y4Z8_9HEMI
MNAKKSKLEQQFVSVASDDGIQISNIFKDIAIFVNGLTEPSADELRFLMMKHGGLYHHYYSTERTTHVIASNLPYSKMKLLKSMKVVKPQWIVDSIEANKVLDYRDYLLYTSESRTQPKLPFKTNFTTESNSNRWIARNASDSNFLSEFYNNSRLHLISTMGATFKEYINKLRSSGKNVYPGLETLKAHVNERLSRSTDDCTVENCKNVIMHIDMDCFFVSVGIRNRHHLMGKPVAVTHARGNNAHPREGADPTLERKLYAKKYEEKTGTEMRKDHWSKSLNETDSMAEIASCSYEARKYGIKNGMFLGQALKLCPDLKTIPYDFEDYKEVAFVLYDTVAKYTLNIEAVSCDEMFVDCSEILSATSATVTEFASILRREIKEKTGCPCSTGFGNNRLQARLATKKAKPDGQFYLKPENVSDFMNNIDISDLPGVGSSTSHKLHSMGIRTCGKLQALPLHKLQSEFGNKLGETLYKNSRGIDEKKLVFTNVRKSVSAEVNYGIRFQNDTDRDKFLKQLSEEVSSRLAEVKMKGKCITLKIMVRSKEAPEETAKYMGHGLCDYITKSCTLSSPVFEANSIFREVLTIINNLNVKAKELRGIGIQISRLENNAVSNNLKKFFDQNDKKTLVSKVTKTFDNANNREKELINMPSTSKACTLQSDINLADVSISQVFFFHVRSY